MDFLSFALRQALVDAGNIYLPYQFTEPFPEAEKFRIIKKISEYVSEPVNSTFNTLCFTHISFVNRFGYKLATYDDWYFYDTVEEVLELIDKHFGKRE